MKKIIFALFFLTPLPLFAQFGVDYKDLYQPAKEIQPFPNRYLYNPRANQDTVYFHKKIKKVTWKNQMQTNQPYNNKTDSYCVQRGYAKICD